ncbi:MAG: hypothetical protein ABI376_06105 [Caulobacteraceae bacterium]
MNRIFTAGVAALTLCGATATVATPAAARDWNGGYGYHHDNDTGAAIAGGLVGLALGAVIAGNHNQPRYYNQGYYGSSSYGSGYYGSGYGGSGYYGSGDGGSGYDGSGYGGSGYYGSGYAPQPQAYYGSGYGYGGDNRGYSTCVSRRSVWDPYAGRYVTQRVRSAC